MPLRWLATHDALSQRASFQTLGGERFEVLDVDCVWTDLTRLEDLLADTASHERSPRWSRRTLEGDQLQCGDHRQLVGVVSEPATSSRRIGFVLVNASVVPKHGPFRMYVLLARCLADAGIVTLRFDLGGIGDSQQGYANQPLKARTMLEIRAAVGALLSTAS